MTPPLSTECSRPRSRLIAALCGWHLFCVSLSYAVVGDAPLFPLGVAIAAVVAVSFRHSIPITTRFLAYSLTTAVLLTVVLNSLYPVDGDRFFVPVSTELTFPVLITIACALLFLEQRASIIACILAIGLTLFMLQGATVNDPSNHVRLQVSNSFFWRDRFFLFAVTLALQVPAILLLPYLVRRGTPIVKAKRTSIRFAAWLASLCALVLFTVLASWLMNRYFQQLDDLTRNLISQTHRKPKHSTFSSSVDLRRTLDLKTGANNTNPVLLIQAAQPPGYLRGRAYNIYEGGQWTTSGENVSIPTVELPGISVKRFSLFAPATDNQRIVDIYPTGNFSSSMPFITGNTNTIDLIADALVLQDGGTLVARNLKESAGWRIRSDRLDQGAAWPAPSPPADATLLKIPEALAEALAPLTVDALRGAPQDPTLRALHVGQWVANRCTYSLDAEQPRNADPALGFLRTSRAGHCELFATATVLLLRQAGIPARYVMGYVAMMPAGREGWYVARRADCHAWVEAWDGERWMLVEPTPASGIPKSEEIGWATKFKLALASAYRDVLASMERGYFADAVTTALLAAGSGVAWLFWSGPWPIGWALAIAIGLLVYRLIRHKSTHESPQTIKERLYPIIAPLLIDLARYGIRRSKSTTIDQIASSVAASEVPSAEEVKSLLRDYEALRFGPEDPSQDQIRHLKLQVTELRSAIK